MTVMGRDCAEGRKWLTPGAPGVQMARPRRRGAASAGSAGPGGPGRPQGRQQQLRAKQLPAPWPGPRRWVSAPRSPYLAPGSVRAVGAPEDRPGERRRGSPAWHWPPSRVRSLPSWGSCDNPVQGQSPVRLRSRGGPPGSLSVSDSACAEPRTRLTLLFSLPAKKKRK